MATKTTDYHLFGRRGIHVSSLNHRKEKTKMKKFVSTLGLGLLLGCFGACGDDLGAPKPDGGGPDGAGSGGDGGGSSEAGRSIYDSGNTSYDSNVSEASLADVGVVDSSLGDVGNAVEAQSNPDQAADTSVASLPDVGVADHPDVGVADHPVPNDSGLGDVGNAIGSVVDAPSNLDQEAPDTSLQPVGLDGGTLDARSILDVTDDLPVGLDGESVDTESSQDV
jgi:hypothetical protein